MGERKGIYLAYATCFYFLAIGAIDNFMCRAVRLIRDRTSTAHKSIDGPAAHYGRFKAGAEYLYSQGEIKQTEDTIIIELDNGTTGRVFPNAFASQKSMVYSPGSSTYTCKTVDSRDTLALISILLDEPAKIALSTRLTNTIDLSLSRKRPLIESKEDNCVMPLPFYPGNETNQWNGLYHLSAEQLVSTRHPNPYDVIENVRNIGHTDSEISKISQLPAEHVIFDVIWACPTLQASKRTAIKMNTLKDGELESDDEKRKAWILEYWRTKKVDMTVPLRWFNTEALNNDILWTKFAKLLFIFPMLERG